MGYFEQTDYVSNSDLSRLKERLQDKAPINFKGDALAFGSLVHARLLEPHEVDRCESLVDPAKHEKARLMEQVAREDQSFALLHNGARFEHEIYRKSFDVYHEGKCVQVPVRAKLDIYKREYLTGADIKTTACRNEASFRKAILNLDYDRQSALYMNIGLLDYFYFIGIGKERDRFTRKHPIFKFLIIRGSPEYLAGKAKYEQLIYQHHLSNRANGS